MMKAEYTIVGIFELWSLVWLYPDRAHWRVDAASTRPSDVHSFHLFINTIHQYAYPNRGFE